MHSESSSPADAALAIFAALSQQALDLGISLRAPPPVPQTCCGRGCNGCVWEGFFAAAAWWEEESREILAAHSAAPGN